MKQIRNYILSLMALSLLPSLSVSAATQEDVLAAAQAAGFSDYYVSQGANYISGGSYTPEQYDKMIGIINSFSDTSDAAIEEYLNGAGMSAPDSKPENETPVVSPDNEQDAESATENEEIAQQEKPVEQNQITDTESKETVKNFADMTPDEKKEYISGMTSEEKNQIIKNLDKEKQIEILNGLIDASTELGMHVTVDDISDNTLKYSIRNNQGDIVDVSSVGVVVDDTGIDYTILLLLAGSAASLSIGGIAGFALWQKKNTNSERL